MTRAASSGRATGGRTRARSSRGRRARARRAAPRPDGRALDLADQQLDDHPAHRLDRLPHGRQRRVGAVHERRVVEADDRHVARARDSRPGAPPGSRRARSGRWRRRSRSTPRASSRVAAACPPSSEKRVRSTSSTRREAPTRRADVTSTPRACAATARGRAGPGAGRSARGRARRGGLSPARWRPRRRTRRAGSRGGRRGVDEHGRQPQLQQPRVVVVRRVRLGVLAAGEDDARDLLLEQQLDVVGLGHAAAVCVQSTGVKPCCASAPPTTSASAGKIGFWSSGRTRPTIARARRAASSAARSRARRAR